MSTPNTLARTSQQGDEPKGSIKQIIQTDLVRDQLMAALPKYYTPDSFVVVVRTAINKNPKLQECTPESFLVAMLTAAQMGIAPDGRNGHLIPRNRKLKDGRWIVECQFQPDYKGLVSLIRRNNENVADVYAELVHDKDEIVVTKGLRRDLVHSVDIRADRGDLIGVYAVISYKDGTSASFEYLSRAEVEKVRARSESWKSHVSNGYDTPWLTDEGEMWKKTALKRLLKLADLSPDTSDRLAAGEEETLASAHVTEIRSAEIPAPQTAPVRELPEPTPAAEVVPVETVAKPVPVERKAASAQVEAPSEPKRAPRAKPQPPARTIEDELAEKPAAAKKVTPKAEQDPKSAIVGRVREELAKAGYTEAQMIAACKRQDWGDGSKAFDPEKTKLEAVDLETLESFLDGENWETVVLVELNDIASAQGEEGR